MLTSTVKRDGKYLFLFTIPHFTPYIIKLDYSFFDSLDV